MKKGLTSVDGNSYLCDICKEQKGWTRFEEHQIKDYSRRATKRTKKPPMRCLDCETTHARYHVCESWKKNEEQRWTENQLNHIRKARNPRPLVCAGCIDRGYIAKDL